MRENRFARNSEELSDIKKAMQKMNDALGVNYTSFSEVMEHLDDLRLDMKPTQKTMESINSFKHQSENNSTASNPFEFWYGESKKCRNVIEAVRLYLEANAQQFSGVGVIKNRILYLANKGEWK